MLFVVCCLLCVMCCLCVVGCCVLFGVWSLVDCVCRSVLAVCCSVFAVGWLLFVVCCVLCVVRCLTFVGVYRSLLFDVVCFMRVGFVGCGVFDAGVVLVMCVGVCCFFLFPVCCCSCVC